MFRKHWKCVFSEHFGEFSGLYQCRTPSLTIIQIQIPTAQVAFSTFNFLLRETFPKAQLDVQKNANYDNFENARLSRRADVLKNAFSGGNRTPKSRYLCRLVAGTSPFNARM